MFFFLLSSIICSWIRLQRLCCMFFDPLKRISSWESFVQNKIIGSAILMLYKSRKLTYNPFNYNLFKSRFPNTVSAYPSVWLSIMLLLPKPSKLPTYKYCSACLLKKQTNQKKEALSHLCKRAACDSSAPSTAFPCEIHSFFPLLVPTGQCGSWAPYWTAILS